MHIIDCNKQKAVCKKGARKVGIESRDTEEVNVPSINISSPGFAPRNQIPRPRRSSKMVCRQ
jgi:hypothetical protein